MNKRRNSFACEALESRTLLAAQITGFTLINADTDQPIATYASLTDGAVLDLSTLPTKNLSIRANVGGDVGSVKFDLDGVASHRVENGAPFALESNIGPDYLPWTLAIGTHTVAAKPYGQKNAAGEAGQTLSIRFNVVAGARRLNVTASPVGTSGLQVNWDWLASAGGDVARYSVTATPGTYWGPTRRITVDATATSANITGLESFKLYSIHVRALTAAGVEVGAGQISAWTAPAAMQQRYLYAVSLPYDRRGFKNLSPQIEVFDINDGHRWVKNIPLPQGIYNARGLAANAATDRLYLSFFDTPANRYQPGGLLCLDLNTDQVLWVRRYDPALIPAPDRFALTPDGKKIYMPTGEGSGSANWWVVLDAATGEPMGKIHHVSNPHNTLVSIDGRYALLEGQEMGEQPQDLLHTVAVVDTATDQVIRKIGPFRDVVRPLTVNGSSTLLFATLNNFVGFQVADVTSGKVLYTVPVPGVEQPSPTPWHTHCHGIAITPDEKMLLLVDRVSGGIQVFDISNIAHAAPRHIKFIPTRREGLDLAGNPDPAASNDTNNMPGWIATSYDGRYMYPESGEIIDVATLKVIGHLRGAAGLYAHSKFMVEVVFDGGKAIRAADQFGVGRVR